jgi:hypothetical protein
LGDEIDAEKPYLEREFGCGKYCLPDQGCLRMTTVALVDFAAMDFAISSMATLRALKALRPAHPEKYGSALLFSAVLGEKLCQTQTSLELDFVFGHGILLLSVLLEKYPIGPGTNSVLCPEKIAED